LLNILCFFWLTTQRDGFVVDDADDEPIKKRSADKDGDGLEDSDDDDDDDDDDDAAAAKRKKLRKMRDGFELDDDDLALINEAKGIVTTTPKKGGEDMEGRKKELLEDERRREIATVKAKSAQELSRGLFTGDTDSEDDDDDDQNKQKKQQQAKKQQQQQQLSSSQPERYDEDGLDDFIEDDTGYGLEDDDDYGRGGGMGGGLRGDKGAISEAQINEAEEIFGTDYLDFMDGGGGGGEEEEDGLDEDYDPTGGRSKRRKSKFKEAGVGVALGINSDEEIEDDSTDEEDSEDDDAADLFGDDDIMEDDMGYKQRAEVLKLKREKKRLAREERRRQKRERADAKRKAQLRRAFEPVQLVENFCTERDDAIRMVDSPERYYDWLEANKASSSARKVLAISDEIDIEEEEEAIWIMQKIPAFSSEIATAVSNATAAAAAASAGGENAMIPDTDDVMEKADRSIIESIVYALRYMRGEKLEPEFIKRYRMDIVTSPAVRDNLYRIMDEDSEWERMTEARTKIEGVLTSFREEEEETVGGSNNKGGGPEVERAARLKEQFKVAEEKLNGTVEQERKVQEHLDALEKPKEKGGNDDDDDDDLFGDDDEDDEAVSCIISFFV
jgi:hypothetical protein